MAAPSPPAPPVWTEAFRVRAYEVGPGGVATPLALCDYLQEAAGEHARALGVETLALPTGPGVWVLARLRVEIARLPGWRERVTVETWPSAEDGLRASRDFRVRGEDAALLARATTEWLVVDVARRRPVRLPPVVRALRPPDQPRALPAPAEAPAFPEPVEGERPFVVRRSDLDRNAHANNVRFVEWALEAVPEPWAQGRRLTHLDVAFHAEARLGDRVLSFVGPPGPGGEVAHGLVRGEDRRVLALARTTWAAA